MGGNEHAQAKSLAIVSIFTSTLSFLGSVLIILDVLADTTTKTKNKPQSVYHRIMVGLSVADAMNSLGMAVSILPVDSSLDVWGAMSNHATCRVQGWILQVGGSACFVYGALPGPGT